VKSARYAGEDRTFSNNIEKLLHNLKAKQPKARFRTVISLILDGQEHLFEASAKVITHHAHRRKSFGYDPVFTPEGPRAALPNEHGRKKSL